MPWPEPHPEKKKRTRKFMPMPVGQVQALQPFPGPITAAFPVIALNVALMVRGLAQKRQTCSATTKKNIIPI